MVQPKPNQLDWLLRLSFQLPITSPHIWIHLDQLPIIVYWLLIISVCQLLYRLCMQAPLLLNLPLEVLNVGMSLLTLFISVTPKQLTTWPALLLLLSHFNIPVLHLVSSQYFLFPHAVFILVVLLACLMLLGLGSAYKSSHKVHAINCSFIPVRC